MNTTHTYYDAYGTAVFSTGVITVTGSGGLDQIDLGTGISTAITGSGQDTINMGSGLAFIVGGSGPVTVNGGVGSFVYRGGSGAAYIDGGKGSETVDAGAGGGLIVGGSSGHNLLVAGSGQVEFLGNTGYDKFLLANSKANIVEAQGQSTVNATGDTGNDFLLGDHDTILAGSGNDTLYTDANGGDKLTGGAGTDTFTIGGVNEPDPTIIKGFHTGDLITSYGGGTSEASYDLAHSTVVGGNTVIDLSGGAQITLVGYTHVTSTSFGPSS